MGMQYDAVAFGQAGQSLFDFLDGLCQRDRDLMPARRTACLAQSVDETMVDLRIQGSSVHRTVSWVLNFQS
jgi:hypothetical protein